VALYLLNYKRKALADVETRYETTIIVENDDTLIPPDCHIERSGDVKVIEQPKLAPINNRPNKNLNAEEDAEDEETDDGSKRRKRRRGRRRKRSVNDNAEVIETADTTVAQDESSGTESTEEAASEDGEEAASEDGEEGQNKRRRRGRRGGRSRGRKPEDNVQTETKETAEVAVAAAASNDAVLVDDAAVPAVKVTGKTEEDVVEAPKPRRRRKRKTTDGAQEGTADVQVIPITVAEAKVPEASAEEAPEAEVEVTPEVKEEGAPKKPPHKTRRKAAPKKAKEETESAETAPAEAASTEADSLEEVAEAPKPKRRRRAKAVVKEVATEEAPVITTEAETPTPESVAAEPAPEVEEKLAKKGWWRR
jgi:ribonuclease E